MDNDFSISVFKSSAVSSVGIDGTLSSRQSYFSASAAFLAFSGDSGLKLFNLFVQFSLFALVLPGQHREVVFRDTPRRPVLIHPGKQGINFGFPLSAFSARRLLLSCGGLSLVIGV